MAEKPTQHQIETPSQAPPASKTITPPGVKAIEHWSSFGRPGHPSPTRVTASAWKREPFKKPEHAAWHVPIPADQLGKLLNGFRPSAMEDKWFVYAEGPDAEGRVLIHMHRSWTGKKIVELEIKMRGDSEEEKKTGSAEIMGITWEMDEEVIRDHSEEKAKYNALEVCKWVLGVRLVE